MLRLLVYGPGGLALALAVGDPEALGEVDTQKIVQAPKARGHAVVVGFFGRRHFHVVWFGWTRVLGLKC